MKRHILRLLSPALAMGLALVASQARADILLVPGASSIPITQGTLNNETFVASIQRASLGNSPANAVLNEAVFREASGSLTVVYQLVNNGSTPLSSLTVSNFANFVTTVGSLGSAAGTVLPPSFPGNSVGSNDPILASRTPTTGDAINFSFDATPLAVGATSSLFFVRTNAVNFNRFGAGLLTGTNPVTGANVGGDVFINLLQPSGIAVVPEPSTFVGAGVAALFSLGFAFRRKRTA